MFPTIYFLDAWKYDYGEYYIRLNIHKRIFSRVVYLIFLFRLSSRHVCLKRCRSWTKRDSYELDKTVYSFFMSRCIHLFICWPGLLLFFPDHLFLLSVTPDNPMSNLQQEPPVVKHQIDVSKNQEQSSISSRDIVEIDQQTNFSGYGLRIDKPAISSGEK